MMQRIFIIALLIILSGFQREKPAYRIFSADGEPAVYSDIMNRAADADLIFYGELHNNPVAHWLRQEIAEDLRTFNDKPLVAGGEMFERDNQQIIDEYLKGYYEDRHFENEAKLWPNYETDYRPFVHWARANEVPLIATNIPRRYAAMVAGSGLSVLDTIGEEALNYIAPLPLEVDTELKSYQKMMKMAGPHGSETFLEAQAVKDATMAHSILEHFEQGSNRFFHVNGAFHTLYGEGIIWYIEQNTENLSVLTISVVEQERIDTLDSENKGGADFLIAVPGNMTKTH